MTIFFRYGDIMAAIFGIILNRMNTWKVMEITVLTLIENKI